MLRPCLGGGRLRSITDRDEHHRRGQVDGTDRAPTQLTPAELAAWQGFLRAHAFLSRVLEAELLAEQQLSATGPRSGPCNTTNLPRVHVRLGHWVAYGAVEYSPRTQAEQLHQLLFGHGIPVRHINPEQARTDQQRLDLVRFMPLNRQSPKGVETSDWRILVLGPFFDAVPAAVGRVWPAAGVRAGRRPPSAQSEAS